ncbi:sulfotransferase family 2 domain-containing protein [uncultured Cohaesibacter sp.]|uniref:sulfotransferase family 2 domain-containing protein n=1 Tax=uncultured Cohaesibacter sp. TaxID=1002546 RepID=UPI0029C993FD|nr:sulfotransferase family 2 domain-containing protein [uncultured Cohaesibacter sp.]
MHERTVFERLSRAVHYIDGSNLVYVENPKVACSNIKWSLVNMFRPEMMEDITRIHDRRETPFITGFPDIVASLRGDNKTVFSVVRHPRKRFISAYFDKMYEGRDQSVWRLIANHLELEEDKVYEPKIVLDRLIGVSKQDLDPHVGCQYGNLFLGAIPYTKIFHLEKLDKASNELSFSDFTLQMIDRQSHSTSSRVKASVFDEEALEMVDAMYADDYVCFNYRADAEAPVGDICLPDVRDFFLEFLGADRPVLYLKHFFEGGPQELSLLETEAVIDRISQFSLWDKLTHRLLDFIIVRNAIQQKDNIARFNAHFTEFPS